MISPIYCSFVRLLKMLCHRIVFQFKFNIRTNNSNALITDFRELSRQSGLDFGCFQLTVVPLIELMGLRFGCDAPPGAWLADVAHLCRHRIDTLRFNQLANRNAVFEPVGSEISGPHATVVFGRALGFQNFFYFRTAVF